MRTPRMLSIATALALASSGSVYAGESYRMKQEMRILGAAVLCSQSETLGEAYTHAQLVVRHTAHQALKSNFKSSEIENGAAGHFMAKTSKALSECKARIRHLRINDIR